MTNDIDLDAIDDRDDLVAVLGALQERLRDVEARVRDLQETRGNLFEKIEANAAAINELEDQIDDLNGHVEVVDATIDTPRKGKIGNIHSVIDHAHEKGARGMEGTMLKTGEVHAAISGSRNTALRLIDEIAGTFEWADAENPGGQKQKRLKLTLGQPVESLKADVTDHYANRGEAPG